MSLLNPRFDATAAVLWERQRIEGAIAKYLGYTPNFMKVETSVTNEVLLENRIVDTRLSAYNADSQAITGIVK